MSRIGKFVSGVLAIDVAIRSASYLKARAKFPMLRANLQRLKQQGSQDMSDLDNQTLAKTAIGHLALLVFMALLELYGLLMTARGIGALLRLDTFTIWIIYGPLIVVLTGGQLISSWHSRANAKRILEARRK